MNLESVSNLNIEVPSKLINNIKVNVQLKDYSITSIDTVFNHELFNKIMLGLKIESDTENYSEGSINPYHDPIEIKNINNKTFFQLYLHENDSFVYKIIDHNVRRLSDTLIIIITLERKNVSKSRAINPIDPVLMYYRYVVPYSSLAMYGVFGSDLYPLGKIHNIIYNKVHDTFDVVTDKKIIARYKFMPFSKPEHIVVQGTQITNPLTVLYILDEKFIEDLIWVDQIQITNFYFDEENELNPRKNIDFINKYNNKQISIIKIEYKIKSINTIVVFDFEVFPHLNPNEIIQNITYTEITTIPIPFRKSYFSKLFKESYQKTYIKIYYKDTSDNNSDEIKTVKYEGYFKENTRNNNLFNNL